MTEVTDAPSGDGDSIALKSDGKVWTWNYNVYVKLGDGTTDRNIYAVPILVSRLNNVNTITVGRYHTMVLKADDTI